MNCANHPEVPVSAFCQNCGKPLCTQCVRSVAGVVYCEPCLAARLQGGSPYTAVPPVVEAPGVGQPFAGARFATSVRGGAGASPVLAGLLGLIPGVGAMYNGQFIKALVHVVVFMVLVGVAQHFDLAGLLIAAWIFYQVFDSIQTAIARRDGLPLPDPFGINDLGHRMGVSPAPSLYGAAVVPPPATAPFMSTPPAAGTAETPPMPDPGTAEWDRWAARAATEKAMRDAGVPVGSQAYEPMMPAMTPVAYAGRPEPIGAIVLIVVGMLFLLSTLGVFHVDWIGRGWPVLIIVVGLGLLFRRVRTAPRPGGAL